jgi:hypothetical protein
VVLTPNSLTDVAASVDVSAPSAGPTAGWTKYLVSLCEGSTCSTAQECPKAQTGVTTCSLPTLTQHTTRTVEVVAASADGLTLSMAASLAITTRLS